MTGMDREFVSVVMGTFNGARFLPQQLDSILDQTEAPSQLVVSDDDSQDETVDILEQFAARAPFEVVILRNETRLGYGENFLRACDHARGDVIAFCDQDDVWLPDKLERALFALRSSGSDWFVHGATLIDDDGRELGAFRQRIERPGVREPLTSPPWGVLYGFSMVFRREVLTVVDRTLRGAHTFEYDSQLSHDLWIYFLGTSLFTLAVDPAPLVRYRQHTANVTPHLHGRVVQRFTTSMGKAVDPNLPRDRIAAHRAVVMGDLARYASGRLAERANAAAHYWDQIAEDEHSRIAAYLDARLAHRLLSWFRAVRRSAYSRLGWQLGVKDLLAGVMGWRRAKPVRPS